MTRRLVLRYDNPLIFSPLFSTLCVGVAGEYHHEVRGTRLDKILQNNLPILIIFTSLHGHISLLWRGISGNTIERW